jgi:signal transduction histidine kinase
MSHNMQQAASALAAQAWTVPVEAPSVDTPRHAWLQLLGLKPSLEAQRERSQQKIERPDSERDEHEEKVRRDERRLERARIARDLHDSLFQGFLGASMVLHRAVEDLPANAPNKDALNDALRLMYRVIDEGRDVLSGMRLPAPPCTLEEAFANLGDEFKGDSARVRISILGRPRELDAILQDQIYLIGREALVNALRHSQATSIEAEIEYLPGKVRVVVRDNGSGINQDVLSSGRSCHFGLLGMHERARSISAQLRIWSRCGAGTEVEICAADDPSASAATA